jgi:hypothetical protein
MKLCPNTRNEARSPEKKKDFLDSSHHRLTKDIAGLGVDAQGHSGLGRACNMKVSVVVSKSRFNSWPSRCPSCPSFPPSKLNTRGKEKTSKDDKNSVKSGGACAHGWWYLSCAHGWWYLSCSSSAFPPAPMHKKNASVQLRRQERHNLLRGCRLKVFLRISSRP